MIITTKLAQYEVKVIFIWIRAHKGWFIVNTKYAFDGDEQRIKMRFYQRRLKQK